MKNLLLLLVLLSSTTFAQKNKSYQVISPDGKTILKIDAGEKLQWSVTNNSLTILAPSAIAMHLQSGEVLGDKAIVTSAKTEKVNTTFKAINYIKDEIPNVYNQLTLNCKNDYGIIFRAYDDGVAYRFFTKKKGEIVIVNEEANFNFDKDYNCFVPFVRDFRGKEQYIQSFEALYTENKISEFNKDTLGFLPALIDMGDEKKAILLEADLEDYPGMFIQVDGSKENSFKGVFAPYPTEEAQGGYKMLNTMPTKRQTILQK